MIEKITIKYPDFDDLKDKINEIIDYINHSNHEYESIDDVVDDFVKVNETAHKFRSTNERLRNELDRTKKQLEIAVDALKEIIEWDKCVALSSNDFIKITTKALDQIQELEQKE